MEFFEKEIRPVLADNCYSCHGPKKQKASLRLDSRAAVLKGGESGPAVVPGKPDESRLVIAIRHLKKDNIEPMPGDDKKLPDHAIEALAEWIRQDLPWPDEKAPAPAFDPARHWAFQPVKAPAIPAVKNTARVRSPIDAFLLQKLEKEGLAFNPDAPRHVLARRLYTTLTGLPPTADEIAAFANDPAPDAFERLADRLLASPAFGERWARHWLDVARYADSKGYVFEEERRYPYAYTYRDWVVDALNRDLPYDRFLKFQIAADKMVSGDDNRDLAALGFLTLGRRFLNNQNDIIDDRIDVVMRGTQALTVGCARCHDHKFDPIPTADYYSLHAIFLSSEEPGEKPLLKPFKATPASERFDQEYGRLEAKVEHFRQERYDQSFSAENLAAYLALVRTDIAEPKFDAANEAKKQARYANMVERWRKIIEPRLKPDDALFAAWKALATAPAEGFPEKLKTWLAAAPASTHPLLRQRLAAEPPVTAEALLALYGKLLGEARDPAKNSAPDFRPWTEFAALPAGPAGLKPMDLVGHYKTSDAQEHRKLQREAEAFKATSPDSPPRAMVMVDKEKPVGGHILVRGNPGRQGPAVPRRFLEVLSPAPRPEFKQGSGRLELADSIASASNPLTARVFVNRVWDHVFGAPLVDTPSDFGVRTAPPLHPELLDHLASQFVRDGWSVKKLIRAMVLSTAFRENSAFNEQAAAKDPENHLFWHMNRRRLDFETFRDSLLRAAGTLDTKRGGQPFDLLAEPFIPRRTLYGNIERQNLPGLFRTFDFANPDYHNPRRNVTTTPQQALFLLNHPFSMQQADALAKRTEKETMPEERVRQLYRLALGRLPTTQELSLALNFTRDFAKAPPPSSWSNGYGQWNTQAKKVEFTPLPFFKDKKTWCGGDKMPDATLAFASLSDKGGHPGNTQAQSVIRRWTAGPAASVMIEGTLKVPAKESGGVRARVVSARGGLLGEWTVTGGNSTKVELPKVELAPGENLDFILDNLDGPNSDSFSWAPELRDPKTGAMVASAAGDFGETATVLSPWAALAQILLSSNEFCFVD